MRILLACLVIAVATDVHADACASPVERRVAKWPTAFSSYIGRHKTTGNRVLAFESLADSRARIAVDVLDLLLDEAKADQALTVITPMEREDVLALFKAVDSLLIRHRFIYPPCRLVETLTDALSPTRIAPEHIELAKLKNRRRQHILDETNTSVFFTDCDTTALIYRSIGEHLGIDIALVDLPTHTFMRYYLADGSYVNWDPNSARALTDDEYASRYSIPAQDIATGRYLRPLLDGELAGYLFLIRGKRFQTTEMWCQAEDEYLQSIRLYPQSAKTHKELAWMYLTSPAFGKEFVTSAVRHAETAVACDPSNPDFLDVLGWAYAVNKQFAKAAAAEERAAELTSDSTWRARYLLRARAFKKGSLRVDESAYDSKNESPSDHCTS